MGISGLLENLKSITQKRNLSSLCGLRVAVDGHCWLHRGAYSCSKDITNGVYTAKYVSFFMSMIQVLKNSGISHILVVFDGFPLPNKVEVNEKRRETKKHNLGLAKAAELVGDHKLAMTYYQRSVSVTFEMVKNVMSALDDLGVAYMVSPYESDAQLAFLTKHRIVDVVITEDSDVIAYGCPKVFLKMDREGNGDLYQQEDLPLNQTLSFANWTEDQFVLFCCLSGCDYMPGLANFGVKSAHKVVAKCKTLSRVLDHLKLSGTLSGYNGCFAARLEQAIMTFRHQTIYNPYTKTTEPLTPLPHHHCSVSVDSPGMSTSAGGAAGAVAGKVQRRFGADGLPVPPGGNVEYDVEYSFLGPLLDPDTAKHLVAGNLDPRSLQRGITGGGASGAAEDDHATDAWTSHQQPQQPQRLPQRDACTSGSEGVNWGFTFAPQETLSRCARSEDRGKDRVGGGSNDKSTSRPSIRWRSFEDHQAAPFARRASTDGPAITVGTTRCRGRLNKLAPTISGFSSAVLTSAAASSHAAQHYHSTLVSDALQGMHRQVRPRIAEPNYHKRQQQQQPRQNHHVDDPVVASLDLRDTLQCQQLGDSPDNVHHTASGQCAFDEEPTPQHHGEVPFAGAGVALDASPPGPSPHPSGKRKRFFDSPDDLSPNRDFPGCFAVEAPEEGAPPTATATALPRQQWQYQTGGDSVGGDDYSYSDQQYGLLLDSEASYVDVAPDASHVDELYQYPCGEGGEELAVEDELQQSPLATTLPHGGLPQFQDDVFPATHSLHSTAAGMIPPSQHLPLGLHQQELHGDARIANTGTDLSHRNAEEVPFQCLYGTWGQGNCFAESARDQMVYTPIGLLQQTGDVPWSVDRRCDDQWAPLAAPRIALYSDLDRTCGPEYTEGRPTFLHSGSSWAGAHSRCTPAMEPARSSRSGLCWQQQQQQLDPVSSFRPTATASTTATFQQTFQQRGCSAVSEVAHFLHDMDRYEGRARHQLFPSLSGSASSYCGLH